MHLLRALAVRYRLSGTGSSGATIRLYIEQYTDDKARLKEDAQKALADIIKVGDD
jgi:phosphoglucomutase